MMQESLSPKKNFAALSSPYCDEEKARVVVLPVPFDGSTDWPSGARYGPKAIIDASRYIELYDMELDRDIYPSRYKELAGYPTKYFMRSRSPLNAASTKVIVFL